MHSTAIASLPHCYAYGSRKSVAPGATDWIRSVRKLPANELRVAFAVPGDLATPTGGYGYDRRIIQELRRLGWQVDVVDIGGGFPFPSIAERATALAMLSSVPAGCPMVLDGLAFGALPEAGALRCHTPLIALVHQPLALDPGLDTTQADTFRESERAALAAAARVVVTSEATARIMIGDYDVPAQRISVVRPGNDPVPASAWQQWRRRSASLDRFSAAGQRIRFADCGACQAQRDALAADDRG